MYHINQVLHDNQSLVFSNKNMTMSSTSSGFNTLNHVVREKLTRDNFCLWKVQVWLDVRGAQLTKLLDGTKKVSDEYIIIENQDKT
jgi:hypothetical protein